jgi:hypothetical protein
MGVQNIHILGFRLFEEDCRMKIPIIWMHRYVYTKKNYIYGCQLNKRAEKQGELRYSEISKEINTYKHINIIIQQTLDYLG